MLDENKWLASRHGLEGELVDLPERDDRAREGAGQAAVRPPARHAQDLGAADELEGVLDLLERGNGAYRQRKVYEANRDFSELLQDIVDASAPSYIKLPRRARRRRILGCPHVERPGPLSRLQELWCEVSPYITECPYCGTRIQKRAPKLDRGGVPKAPRSARARARSCRGCGPGEIPGIRADRRPWAAWLLVLAPLIVTIGSSRACFAARRSRYGAGLDDPWRAFTSPFAYDRPAMRRSRSARSRCSAGCSSAGTAGGRRCLCSWSAAWRRVRGRRVRRRGHRRGANGAALGLLAAWTMRDVLGRRAAARTTATCWACSRSPPCWS